MAGEILELTDDSFDQEVISADGPSLVDFWAAWCAPCKMIAPIVEELAGEYAGKLKVAKLNVDDNPKTATRFGIRGIPTLLLFKGGGVVEQFVGVQKKEDIRRAIEGTL